MLKKVVYSVGALFFVFGFSATPAHAIVECTNGEVAESVEACPEAQSMTDDEATGNVSIDAEPEEGIMSLDDCEGTDSTNCESADGSIAQPDKPTGEIEADADDEESTEEATEPEMWPIYVSLGSLGAAFLLIIIINLVGRKSRQ